MPGTSKLLVNENLGLIFLIDTETLEVVGIAGAPDVVSSGQGGLLDVTGSPDFESDSFINLTYSAVNEARDSATHLVRATLNLDKQRLSGIDVLYVAEPL